MESYKYYHKETTPLTYHRIFNFILLPIWCITTAYDLFGVMFNKGEYTLPWYLFLVGADILFLLTSIEAFIGLLKWKKYGWYATMVCLVSRLFLPLILAVITLKMGLRINSSQTGSILGAACITIPSMIYYNNRKPLFCDVRLDGRKNIDLITIIHVIFAFIVFPTLSTVEFLTLAQMIKDPTPYSASWLIYGILMNLSLGICSLGASIGLIQKKRIGWYMACLHSGIEILCEIVTLILTMKPGSASVHDRILGIILSVILAVIVVVFYTINKTEIFDAERIMTNDIYGEYFSQNIYSDSNSSFIKEPVRDAATHEGALYCRKCGAKLKSDSVFCDKCGTKVE